jgi:hypothetical protein
VTRRPTAAGRGRSLAGSLLTVAALAAVVLATGCRGESGAGGTAGGGQAGIGSILKDKEEVILQRMLPESLGDGAVALVVRAPGAPVELRIAERQAGGALTVTHTSRPGDEFKNLSLEDLTGDGKPEIASTWLGGQLEVIEVLGRGDDGTWKALLQNAGQTVETRRRADHAAAFWITSRTYEEETGQPPVYQTTIYEWNGTAFSEPGAGSERGRLSGAP